MIPMSRDVKIEWTDEDGSLFKFNVPTGEHGFLINRACEVMEYDPTPYIKEATIYVNELAKNEQWDAKRLDYEIRRYAISCAKKEFLKSADYQMSRKEDEYICRVVDEIAYSVTVDGKETVFSKDASCFFSANECMVLFSEILKTVHMSDEDKKKLFART